MFELKKRDVHHFYLRKVLFKTINLLLHDRDLVKRSYYSVNKVVVNHCFAVFYLLEKAVPSTFGILTAGNMPFYGTVKFDPHLITSQILVLQASFYLVQGILLLCLHFFFGHSLSIGFLLEWRRLTVSTASGWSHIAVLVAVSIFVSFLFVPIIERAKKCLDFSVTIFFIHWINTMIYDVSKATCYDALRAPPLFFSNL